MEAKTMMARFARRMVAEDAKGERRVFIMFIRGGVDAIPERWVVVGGGVGLWET